MPKGNNMPTDENGKCVPGFTFFASSIKSSIPHALPQTLVVAVSSDPEGRRSPVTRRRLTTGIGRKEIIQLLLSIIRPHKLVVVQSFFSVGCPASFTDSVCCLARVFRGKVRDWLNASSSFSRTSVSLSMMARSRRRRTSCFVG